MYASRAAAAALALKLPLVAVPSGLPEPVQTYDVDGSQVLFQMRDADRFVTAATFYDGFITVQRSPSLCSCSSSRISFVLLSIVRRR
jgi:hypothetical protein